MIIIIASDKTIGHEVLWWKETTTFFLHALGYLARPMHKKYSITFICGHQFSTCESYDRFFGPSHIPLSAHMYTFRVPPLFAYVISLIWYPLPFWFCLFAIVSSYCFTSEVQKFMTQLKLFFFLSQTPITSCHLIQFPIA